MLKSTALWQQQTEELISSRNQIDDLLAQIRDYTVQIKTESAKHRAKFQSEICGEKIDSIIAPSLAAALSDLKMLRIDNARLRRENKHFREMSEYTVLLEEQVGSLTEINMKLQTNYDALLESTELKSMIEPDGVSNDAGDSLSGTVCHWSRKETTLNKRVEYLSPQLNYSEANLSALVETCEELEVMLEPNIDRLEELSDEQVQSIPDDIWIDVVKCFGRDSTPALFNLYNISSQFTRVIDNYFNKDISIDFNKIGKLNRNVDIVQQVYYMMNYCDRAVKGMYIDGDGLDKDQVRTAVQNILRSNASELQEFHFVGESHAGLDSFLRYVLCRTVNLTEISLTVDRSDHDPATIDLSELASLKSIKVTGISAGHCYAGLLLPIVPLTSLSLTRCAALNISAFKELLAVSKHSLVDLDLTVTNDTFTPEPNGTGMIVSHSFHSLKHIAVEQQGISCWRRPIFQIDLTRSLGLESIKLHLDGIDNPFVEIVLFGAFKLDSINVDDVFDMPADHLELLKNLEFINWSSATTFLPILKRIGYCCGELERITFVTRYDHKLFYDELLNRLPTLISNNANLRYICLPVSCVSGCETEAIPAAQLLLQVVLNSVIDNSNETMETIELNDPDDQDYGIKMESFAIDLLLTSDHWKYKRLKVLNIKLPVCLLPSKKIHDELFSQFNINLVDCMLC